MKRGTCCKACCQLLIVVCGLAEIGHAVDWPTHRGNHRRTGATEAKIIFSVTRAWTYLATFGFVENRGQDNQVGTQR
jgi:hypothetical protein